MWYCLIPVRMVFMRRTPPPAKKKKKKITTIGKDVDFLYCQWKHKTCKKVYQGNNMRSLKKLKIALPHDPTKSLLGIYPRK